LIFEKIFVRNAGVMGAELFGQCGLERIRFHVKIIPLIHTRAGNSPDFVLARGGKRRRMKDISLKQLLEAGAHFGHQARRWNPAMKPYVYGVRDGVHIFDLVKTKVGLEEAYRFVKNMAASGGVILWVGTKRQAKECVREAAVKAGMPYAVQRWPGGFLTNFDQLHKSVRKLRDLKEQREGGELKRYTKREQLLVDRDIVRLDKFLGGLALLDKKPEAMFIVDTKREDVAVREAVRMGIPVVGMVDTNGDPRLVDYVIPVNDDAVQSIELVVGVIADAIEEGKKKSEKVLVIQSGEEEKSKVKSQKVKAQVKSKKSAKEKYESKN